MSSDGGGDNSGVAFQTMRGHNYPALRQFTIFMENRVGQLLEVVKRFEGTGIRICALSISDAAECAFVRFMVSDADRGREILERSGLAIIESDMLGVELPDTAQPLLSVCTALLTLELNISQIMPLIVRPNGNPAVAIMVDNIEIASETLADRGFTLITEGDLAGNGYDD
ncbi:MAG: acetolactate synthase [Planctomycetota bacterium]